jgi:hypothetical protein
MFKKIRETLDFWDLKSFVTAVIILGVLVVIGFFFSSDIRDRFRAADKETFKGRTIAKVISIKTVDKVTQGRHGTRIGVDSYDVSYSYNVNGQTLLGRDHIPLTLENKKLLEELTDKDSNDTITVAFDMRDPGNSILIGNQ